MTPLPSCLHTHTHTHRETHTHIHTHLKIGIGPVHEHIQILEEKDFGRRREEHKNLDELQLSVAKFRLN